MPEPVITAAIPVADRPMRTGEYRYIETHAWWLGSAGPHQHLSEHHVRQWVPDRPELEWLLEREPTGQRRWLTGSAELASQDGYDLPRGGAIGRFRAAYGEFHSANGDDIDAPAAVACHPSRARRRGSWQAPNAEFLALLPRDPCALRARLCGDNPGRWFGPFAAAVTALRTTLVPAELRAAFFPALLGLPDTALHPGVVDLDGRDCLAIVHDAGRTRTELLLDPSDGQFAGERDVLRMDSRCGLTAGALISETAVHTAVVAAVGQRPSSGPASRPSSSPSP